MQAECINSAAIFRGLATIYYKNLLWRSYDSIVRLMNERIFPIRLNKTEDTWCAHIRNLKFEVLYMNAFTARFNTNLSFNFVLPCIPV